MAVYWVSAIYRALLLALEIQWMRQGPGSDEACIPTGETTNKKNKSKLYFTQNGSNATECLVRGHFWLYGQGGEGLCRSGGSFQAEGRPYSGLPLGMSQNRKDSMSAHREWGRWVTAEEVIWEAGWGKGPGYIQMAVRNPQLQTVRWHDLICVFIYFLLFIYKSLNKFINK